MNYEKLNPQEDPPVRFQGSHLAPIYKSVIETRNTLLQSIEKVSLRDSNEGVIDQNGKNLSELQNLLKKFDNASAFLSLTEEEQKSIENGESDVATVLEKREVRPLDISNLFQVSTSLEDSGLSEEISSHVNQEVANKLSRVDTKLQLIKKAEEKNRPGIVEKNKDLLPDYKNDLEDIKKFVQHISSDEVSKQMFSDKNYLDNIQDLISKIDTTLEN